MDLSFDLYNIKGDHVLVSLSSYDQASMSAITKDSEIRNLCFYDVSLVRKGGQGMVGYNILSRIASILADFLNENKNAILCFIVTGQPKLSGIIETFRLNNTEAFSFQGCLTCI